MDLGLARKTVIVTGGGSNVGRGIVLAFAKEEANMVIADMDERQGQKVVAEADAMGKGGRSLLIKTDATDRESIQSMVGRTLQEFGQIDVLVNCAGGGLEARPFVEQRTEDLEKEVYMNLWSALHCCKAVLPHMAKRNQGVIINLGSASGKVGEYQMAVYAATKGAIIAFTKSLAREYILSGIRINSICPGLVVPESRDHVGDGSVWAKGWLDIFTDEAQQEFLRAKGLKRVGRPYDIGNMAVFLASECASYVNGQAISVDGGITMV